MGTDSIGAKLTSLLEAIKKAEKDLNYSTQSLEDFCVENPEIDSSDDPKVISFKNREKIATLEWTKQYEAILGYKCESFGDLKAKILALISYVETGYEDPRILSVVKNDLETFELKALMEHEAIEKITSEIIKRTFLLIDDDLLDRMLIRKALSDVRENLTFIELEDGSDVVDVIKESKPFATLLDIRMPNIDGFDVLKLIRNDPELEQHPVLMLSTSSEQRDRNLAMKAGANAYYSKPASIEAYSDLAASILEDVAA